jgi:hypothetical protein
MLKAQTRSSATSSAIYSLETSHHLAKNGLALSPNISKPAYRPDLTRLLNLAVQATVNGVGAPRCNTHVL